MENILYIFLLWFHILCFGSNKCGKFNRNFQRNAKERTYYINVKHTHSSFSLSFTVFVRVVYASRWHCVHFDAVCVTSQFCLQFSINFILTSILLGVCVARFVFMFVIFAFVPICANVTEIGKLYHLSILLVLPVLFFILDFML